MWAATLARVCGSRVSLTVGPLHCAPLDLHPTLVPNRLSHLVGFNQLGEIDFRPRSGRAISSRWNRHPTVEIHWAVRTAPIVPSAVSRLISNQRLGSLCRSDRPNRASIAALHR